MKDLPSVLNVFDNCGNLLASLVIVFYHGIVAWRSS